LPTLGRPTITMEGSLGVMATRGYMRASNINTVWLELALTLRAVVVQVPSHLALAANSRARLRHNFATV
jgi:hypothetical protein